VAIPSAYVATNLTLPSEGFLTHAHADPVGLQTACIGHLIKKGEVAKKEYSVQECIDIFVKDWKEHQQLLSQVVKVPYRSEWMKGALEDFTFNKGIGNVKSSSLLRELNAKNYDIACLKLADWVYGTVAGKKVKLPGLQIRATEEYKYCMGDVPADWKQTINKWEAAAKDAK
jgi:lysozyme